MKRQGKVLAWGLLVLIVLFFIPLDYFIVAPGEVFNTKDLVIVENPVEKSHFYAPAVTVYENKYFAFFNTSLFNKLNTNLFYFLYAALHPSVDAIQLSDYLPKGTTSEQYESSMKKATELSTGIVKYVVAQRVNKSREEINITINLTSEGPSVAVVLALEAINQLSQEDITDGLKIAAVGNLGKDGHVYSVAAVKQKILAADRENIDIIFIPSGDYSEGMRALETAIAVVPVNSIDQVLGKLQQIKKEKESALYKASK